MDLLCTHHIATAVAFFIYASTHIHWCTCTASVSTALLHYLMHSLCYLCWRSVSYCIGLAPGCFLVFCKPTPLSCECKVRKPVQITISRSSERDKAGSGQAIACAQACIKHYCFNLGFCSKWVFITTDICVRIQQVGHQRACMCRAGT